MDGDRMDKAPCVRLTDSFTEGDDSNGSRKDLRIVGKTGTSY